jgi:hypothetical protein
MAEYVAGGRLVGVGEEIKVCEGAVLAGRGHIQAWGGDGGGAAGARGAGTGPRAIAG